jgi:hypothetical protein
VNSGDRHIRQVIGRDPITPCGRRFQLSSRQALYYNEHPDAIIEDFDRNEYRVVLREIERHVIDWEQQQTPEQAEWVARRRRREHLSTGRAAKAIVGLVRD